MDKISLLKIINNEINTVNNLVAGFNNDTDIQLFEIDLALAKLRDLNNELLLLKKIIDNTTPCNNINITNPPTTFIPSKNIDSLISENNNNVDSKNIEVDGNLSQTPVANTVNSGFDNIATDDKNLKSSFDSDKPITETHGNSIVENNVDSVITEPKAENEFVSEIIIDEQIENKNNIDDQNTNIIDTKADSKNVTIPAKNELIVENKKQSADNKNINAETLNTSKGEIMADKFNTNLTSVNDMLASFGKDKNLATLLIERPVTDLKKAIKLNDRVMYINELFNKDAVLFNTTVDKINNCKNLDQALAIIFQNFNWDQAKPATVSFLELVFRRFTR